MDKITEASMAGERLTDKQVNALVSDEDMSGWTELIRELWRARRSEKSLLTTNERLLAALKSLVHCSHPEGSFCAHYKRAHAAIRLAEEDK